MLTAPFPKQIESIIQSTARINLWDGAIRSGKSVASIYRWIVHVESGPPGDMVMIGWTPITLMRNVVEPYMIPMLGESKVKIVQGSHPYIMCPSKWGPRRVWITGASDVRSEQRIRGMTLAGVYGDEVTLWPEGLLEQANGRCSVIGSQIFLTTNPDSPLHPIKTDYIDRGARGELDHTEFKRFQFRITDNPFLDPAYIDSQRNMHRGMWRRRFIDGEWSAAEDAVFGEYWDPDNMVYSTPSSGRRLSTEFALHLGVDAGFSNPTAGMLLAIGPSIDRYNRNVIVPTEFRIQHATDPEISSRLAEHIAGEDIDRDYIQRVWYDPAAPELGEQFYRDGWTGVSKAKNAVLPGIRTIASLMALNMLHVHESCEALIGELPSYRWDDKAQKRGEDKPLKIQDHSIDALRYAVFGSQRLWIPTAAKLNPAYATLSIDDLEADFGVD